MVTIDLTTRPAPPATFLEGLPRRLALTLPELRLVAELAGDAPLPFELVEQPDGGALSGRLGQSRGSADHVAYTQALASLHDPEDTLRRRGLLTEEGADPGLVGAVGLLATPRLALDIDVAAGGSQVKAWHRHAEGAVATLSTCDGIVFELAWFPAEQWTTELARITAVPADVPSGASAEPWSRTASRSTRPPARPPCPRCTPRAAAACASSPPRSTARTRPTSAWSPGCCWPTAGTPSPRGTTTPGHASSYAASTRPTSPPSSPPSSSR
jgi:hypothetical protein